ncbi:MULTISPECIES: hypothetical protein [unclassified Streptomyces]|uniref:hypothetical protein n=1 Tax=unclassified Streptomyces TaxID=2593676 RepID=UPI0035DE7B31
MRSYAIAFRTLQLDHNTFLRDLCPACGQQPLHKTPGAKSAIATQGLLSLLPAQCRRTVTFTEKQPCGARLDQPGHARRDFPPLAPGTAAVQQELLDHLKGAAPSAARTALADLTLMATVISAAWPRLPDVPVPHSLLDALYSHFDAQQELIGSREPQIKGPPRLDTSWRITP